MAALAALALSFWRGACVRELIMTEIHPGPKINMLPTRRNDNEIEG